MKYEFVYPGSDLDRAKNLVALLGTFWSRIYSASDQLASYATATALTVAQTHRNLLETVGALSRYDVPLFHKELFVPIVLRRDQINSVVTNTARFDQSASAFDDAADFDRPIISTACSFPLPDKMTAVGQLFNKITFPTVTFLLNSDFYVDAATNALVFIRNPFDDAGVAVQQVMHDGKPVDEIVLWGFCAEYDYEYVFNQFAYAVGVKLQTSQGYKDLMNAVFDSLLAGGATAKNLDLALAAICNIPVVLETEETIETVRYDSYGLFIVTDKNVYRFTETAEPLVVPGQKVFAGQPLIDGFDIIEFKPGNHFKELQENLPAYQQASTDFLVTSNFDYLDTETDEQLLLNDIEVCPVKKKDLTALALDNGFVSACLYGDLVFENKEVPLIVDTNHPTRYTYVHFDVNGLPSDVKKFFDDVHVRGVDLAEQKNDCDRPSKKVGTLAHVLDSRKYAETEPKPEHLPATINPLRFLIENVLRNNVFVVRITVSALGQKQLGLYNVRHLRQLLPPQTAMIVIFELAADSETIPAAQRVNDYTTTFVGAEPVYDEVSGDNVQDLGATLSLISGTCQ
jgi:hypothetical protein